ncbi:hypothetical protein DFJ73DRAFT_877413 [Zopfochytrium polystomum]|nr:hypothetical protein DFJ73DRAFT_877413 [Zopfochytrium polystomum]
MCVRCVSRAYVVLGLDDGVERITKQSFFFLFFSFFFVPVCFSSLFLSHLTPSCFFFTLTPQAHLLLSTSITDRCARPSSKVLSFFFFPCRASLVLLLPNFHPHLLLLVCGFRQMSRFPNENNKEKKKK